MRAVGVGVHGKFIYWILEKEFSIWNTLGMTGSWSTEEHAHNRLKFVFSGGDILYFRDQRNFGTLKFVRGKHQLIEKLQSLGPDMLSGEVSTEEFIEILRRKNKLNICKVLMNQSVICGIGNYVKADSLWLAGINPHSTISNLSDAELEKLKEAIQKVLRESYSSGGATIRTYQNLSGEKGGYSEKFLVYNRKIDAAGNPVVRETDAGRQNNSLESETPISWFVIAGENMKILILDTNRRGITSLFYHYCKLGHEVFYIKPFSIPELDWNKVVLWPALLTWATEDPSKTNFHYHG